jgi:GNAT superfamily N-acetyltransferase
LSLGRVSQQPMVRESFTIRRLPPTPGVEASLWQSIRELCCRTGNNGYPIASAQWYFFPKIWIDPYEKLVPEWTYIAEAEQVVIAYLTGCPDTAKFARARFFYCTLPLLMEIGCGRHRGNPDAPRFARRALGLQKNVANCFSAEIRSQIRDRYPAHLHVNVDSPFRGMGVGRRLIESYIADLHGIRVPGVHVYCGPDPVKFYLRLGFQELGSILFHGTEVYALGCPC